MTPPRIVICECGCNQHGPYKARGWIRPCYNRWLHGGKPDAGPRAAMDPAESARIAREAYGKRVAGRIEDYAWLRQDLRLTLAQAAARLGVSERTAQRYEAVRRAPKGMAA